MPLRAFALTIDCNLMHGTEVADAQLGPALSFGRADAEPVENGGNAVVRQRASQFTDQLARSPCRSSSDFGQCGSSPLQAACDPRPANAIQGAADRPRP